MNIKQTVDKRQLVESKLTSQDIFEHYFGKIVLGQTFHSPLRRDETPSVGFYYTSTGLLKMKDFSTGDSIGAIDFVMALYHLDFPSALNKICSDFNLLKIDFHAEIVEKKDRTKEIVEKKHKMIQIIAKRFTMADVDYWKSYGIQSYNTLKFYNMYSIDKLFVDRKKFPLKSHELVFAQYFPKSNHIKCYMPEREKGKRFIGNVNNNEDVQGYWQLNPEITKPELALFTSSNKEIMFLYEREIGSVALNGENHHPNADFIRHMKKYCKTLRTLNDFDEAGEKANKFYEEKHQIKPILKPEYIVSDKKDITDIYKYGDKEQLNRFINEIKNG